MKPLGPRTQWTLNAIALAIQPLNASALWLQFIPQKWAMLAAAAAASVSGIVTLSVTGVRFPPTTSTK